MQNPNTTFVGYLLILSATLTFAVHYLQKGTFDMADWQAVMQALSGVGLIAAKDGSH